MEKTDLPPIAIMGEFEEVKDTIYCLPRRKSESYVYLLLCTNFLLKVGRSNQIARRIKTHEYGLRVYGFNRISYIAVTKPTAQAEQIEEAVKQRLAAELARTKTLTEEWFRSDQSEHALRIFTDVLKQFSFSLVTTRQSASDELASYLDKYFATFPDETQLVIDIKSFTKEIKQASPKQLPTGGRIKEVINKLAARHPECITVNGTTYTFNRSVLTTDFIYRPDNVDWQIYEQLGMVRQ